MNGLTAHLTESHAIGILSSEHYKPLRQYPDADDLALHRENCRTVPFTRRLRELVPLLAMIDCTVEETGTRTEAGTRTVLRAPLIESAMNQNGTHQASVFYLLADYTIGVGMCGALPGVYVTGVHDRCRALPVQYWLKRSGVIHQAPGTGTLHSEIEISAADALRMREELIATGRTELCAKVRLLQDGKLVATAEPTMGMYVDAPRAAGTRPSAAQAFNALSSALLIAGLRQDPMSQRVAGEQGAALARRFTAATPQLPALISARTEQIERLLTERSASFLQILSLGVGLDTKPERLSREGQRWFGLDYEKLLGERRRRFESISIESGLVAVAGDIRAPDWERRLEDAGLNPVLPTILIAEGLLMYFTLDEISGLFDRLGKFFTSDETVLWADHVAANLFTLDRAEVKSFLDTMSRLGEPFLSGFSRPDEVCGAYWEAVESTSAAKVRGEDNAVFQQYLFSTLRRRPQGSARPPGTGAPGLR